MAPRHILTVNAGSSSVRFALFTGDHPPRRISDGKLERLEGDLPPADLFARLKEEARFEALDGIGHRIVHGGPRLLAPCRIDGETLEELKRIAPYDPEHLPREIGLVEAFAASAPEVPQIACFDVTFHRTLPRVAQILAIPRRYFDQGIRRYGFHGISCTFLLEALERQAGPDVAQGRVILAHLGNGSSLTAVHQRHSMDTTMAFSPTAGVPMGSRSGDIDPGVIDYLARHENLDPARIQRMLNHESGLRGVSETTGDVRDLLAAENKDVRAADALAMYCYEIRKRLGGLAAALGGLDTLVFSGGVGEHAAVIRERICRSLEFLGIRLDPVANQANAPVISPPSYPVTVRVIPTDEESVIARTTLKILEQGSTP